MNKKNSIKRKKKSKSIRKIKTEPVNLSSSSLATSLALFTRSFSINVRRISVAESSPSMDSNDFGDLLESLQMEGIMPSMESNDLSAHAEPENMQKWYDEIYDHLKETNHLNILEDGGRIFIIKEVYFPLDVTSPVKMKFPCVCVSCPIK